MSEASGPPWPAPLTPLPSQKKDEFSERLAVRRRRVSSPRNPKLFCPDAPSEPLLSPVPWNLTWASKIKGSFVGGGAAKVAVMLTTPPIIAMDA